nr:hypothetical protein [Tanacetum cinerariifolium]
MGDFGIPTASDEFPLPVYFSTASEDKFPLLSERDAPAEEVCIADEVKVNVLVSNFNHGSTFCKISMLHIPPENNEFE